MITMRERTFIEFFSVLDIRSKLRELTQLQSILQNQIESLGRRQFKQGDLVIPGEVGLNTRLDFVKLSSVTEVAVAEGNTIVYKKYDISQLVGQTLKGITSGVTGVVVSTKFCNSNICRYCLRKLH